MQTELTPTIAEMNEVVAKYIAIDYNANYDKDICKLKGKGWVFFDDIDWDWNRLHEVWEKVREESQELWDGGRIQSSILWETPLETLTALYNAIIFINQLKENNANKYI